MVLCNKRWVRTLAGALLVVALGVGFTACAGGGGGGGSNATGTGNGAVTGSAE